LFSALAVLASLLPALLAGFLPALLLSALARLLRLLPGFLLPALLLARFLVRVILLLLVTHCILLGFAPSA
jgi:hypothetical protein